MSDTSTDPNRQKRTPEETISIEADAGLDAVAGERQSEKKILSRVLKEIRKLREEIKNPKDDKERYRHQVSELEEFPEKYTVILTGPPGVGKHLYILDRVKSSLEKGESVTFINTEKSPEEIKKIAKGIGLNLDKYEGGKFTFLDVYSHSTGERYDNGFSIDNPANLNLITVNLTKAADVVGKPMRVFFDSLSTLFLHAPEPEIKKFFGVLSSRVKTDYGFIIYTLQDEMHDEQTVIALKHMVDCVLEMRFDEGPPLKNLFRIHHAKSMETKPTWFEVEISEKGFKILKENQESRPDIFLKIIGDNFQVNKWNKINIELTNSGNVNAKNIKTELTVPDADIRKIKKIKVLNPHENKNLTVGIRPPDAGNLPLEANVTYSDSGGTKYEYEDSFWIKVSDPKIKKSGVDELYCITGGTCNREIKLNEKQYFVGHSFTRQHNEDLRNAIENVLEKFDLEPYYADREVKRGTVLCKICEKIRSTRLGIYEISDKNPNVMIELGMGLGFGKPVLLIANESNEDSSIPTNINNLDRIVYSSFNELTQELEVKIKKFIS